MWKQTQFNDDAVSQFGAFLDFDWLDFCHDGPHHFLKN